MSTKTNNLKMTLPTGTENITRSVINGNFEIVDAAVGSVQDGLAIVSDGDTHGAIANGQFVYVRNHNTLAEGLYKARAAIGANVALSTSNLTANGSGGLNDLQSQVNTLSSQIAGYGSSKIYTFGANQSITIPMTGFGVWLIFRSYAPNIVFVKANGDVESAVGNADHISVSVSNNILTVTNLLTWANMIIAMGA